jgi:hypothetical protein
MGQFLVVRADYNRQLADLVPVSGPRNVLEGVPFSRLFAPWETETSSTAASDRRPSASLDIKDRSVREIS